MHVWIYFNKSDKCKFNFLGLIFIQIYRFPRATGESGTVRVCGERGECGVSTGPTLKITRVLARKTEVTCCPRNRSPRVLSAVAG